MRLDRLLALLGEGTRSQVRGAVRDGRVTVNGAVAHDAGMRVDASAWTEESFLTAACAM